MSDSKNKTMNKDLTKQFNTITSGLKVDKKDKIRNWILDNFTPTSELENIEDLKREIDFLQSRLKDEINLNQEKKEIIQSLTRERR